MTYMNTANFESACAIQPLSCVEIEEIAGGPLPLAAVPVIIGGTWLLSEFFHHHV
ncbi:hypothetical protein [Porphyrobacter sp. TH134]|uniref:hypothetical protein n=1 Tax=Porphyrobacter sp. TH134 TaxID=2067450 RepID=UPI00155488B6|nr:hypothetical protein [Porphyrobacter sp. TH134]